MTEAGQPGRPPEPPSGQPPLRRASGRSILLGIIAVSVVLYAIRFVLLPFVLAGAAAFAISPAVDWFTARVRYRWITALLVVLVLLAVAGVIALFVLPAATHAAVTFAGNAQKLIYQLVATLTGGRPVQLVGKSLSPDEIASTVVAAMTGWIAEGGRLLLVASWAFSIAFGLILTLVVFAYFVASGDSIGRGIFGVIPPAQRPVCEEIWERSAPILRRYFVGIVLVVTYATIAAYVGLGLFLHIPDALLLAILTGLLEMVPVIGPAAAAIIAGLAAVETASGAWSIIAYIIYAVALRVSIDELIGPIILGRAGRIHPTLVIFCFLAGGLLFGVVGLIMAVPVALVVKVALEVLYAQPDLWGDDPPVETGAAPR